MAIVNFSIPKTLERRVADVMREKGFASKAEFFRLAAIHFIDIIDKPFANEEERFLHLSKILQKTIRERYHKKNIPSLREQLADM